VVRALQMLDPFPDERLAGDYALETIDKGFDYTFTWNGVSTDVKITEVER
jgi:hypothetical protein